MAKKTSKLEVIHSADAARVPFLRGILTASLRRAGLPFDDAYRLADAVRTDLSERGKGRVTTSALETHVAERLREEGFASVAERYEHPAGPLVPVWVEEASGGAEPFSKAHLARALELCALPPEDAYAHAARVEQALGERGQARYTRADLSARVAEHLREDASRAIAERYERWRAFRRGGHPLILLVGGTTGSGKSTVASDLAYHLGIARAQSTDMLREVMRLLIPKRVVPTLHASSFEAWRGLPAVRLGEGTARGEPARVLDGFLTQAREVAVAIDGVVRRAAHERLSIIVEGVHVTPQLQRDLIEAHPDALVVPFVLGVLKRKALRRRLEERAESTPSRRAQHYLDHFDAIWALQTHLIEEADHFDIPVLPNSDRGDTRLLATETLCNALAE
jgi:2-phosphoglycerate kinase